MKFLSTFLLDCIGEKLDGAVQYGVNRAYKHSDKEPPTDAQVEIIKDSVRSVLFEIFDPEMEG